MELLIESGDENYLNDIKLRLESNGIPIFISGEETFRVAPATTGLKKGLWVMVDNQINDARLLLENPSHKVSNPIDVFEFKASTSETQYLASSYEKMAKIILAILAMVFLLWFISRILFT